ncbi:MAG: hypothetical protein OSJ36_00910 [Odoribacter sp.]|nr:hypothetical protein [Odoribacter sp.]
METDKKMEEKKYINSCFWEKREKEMFKELFSIWDKSGLGVSNKAVKKGKLYRNFVRKHFEKDKDIGDLVKQLPKGIWWVGAFRFELIWLLLFGVIICLNKYFFLFNSGIFLASVGKFGSATFDAIYVVLYILHIVLYFFIKRYLWIKSKVFINIMIQIDVKLEARLINRKRDMN